MQTNTKTFRDLIVWQRAHEYVLKVYSYTAQFPKNELFALANQYRRSAVSIAANIAEGYRKRSVKDKIRFFNIAQGSLEECRYYEILSNDLKYGEVTQLTDKLEETSRLLNSYSRVLLKKVNSE